MLLPSSPALPYRARFIQSCHTFSICDWVALVSLVGQEQAVG